MAKATISSNQSNSYVFKVGSPLGWANSGLDNSCVLCGRIVGKNSWFVQQSTDGTILAADYEGEESQGFWEIGSECAKKFEPSLLIKSTW